jgi:hypothetical protein
VPTVAGSRDEVRIAVAGAVTVRVIGAAVHRVDAWSVAVTVNVYTPTVVGVPASLDSPSIAGWNVIPGGSEPLVTA